MITADPSAPAEHDTSFLPLFRKVQAAGQDFEWYPTTAEIIAAMVKDLKWENDEGYYSRNSWSRQRFNSFLDIGAGNGKVLDSVRDIEHIDALHAIEKSQPLMQALPKDVFILGVDFWKTSLIDKRVDVVFSNPPYSEFQEWTVKILKEAPSDSLIYLVIPERWQRSIAIGDALKSRGAEAKILGDFDFEAAEDRTARAKVHLLKIVTARGRNRSEDAEHSDPFVRFFNETFTFPEAEAAKPFEEQIEETKVVHRLNFVEALCHLYDLRIEELQRNYQSVCSLAPDILKEFDINRNGLIESLRQKLATAKKEYWQRLFDGMSEINRRLTVNSRKRIVELMQSRTGIEFNRDNAYAIVMWVIKNANSYFDDQLVATYEQMVEFANIEGYVSNQRIFTRDRFRYDWIKSEDAVNYRLKVGHRMVLEHCGGLKNGSSWDSGLDERASQVLCDLIVVARNVGFNVVTEGPAPRSIDDSSPRIFCFRNADGELETLYRVRAFYNRNLHIQFHPEFIHALNVQHGKLKGWLRNDDEAARELEIPIETAAKHFKPGFRLTHTALALMAPAAA